MDNTLGDFLSEEPLPENTEAVVEEPVVEAETEQETAARERDEKGRFKAKEETGVETPQEPVPPTEPTNRLPQAEYAALKDERQKRQQLEERLRQYEEYFTQQSQAPQEPQAIPDMFEDPDGFKAHLRQEILRELQPTIQHGQTLTRAEVSEMLARQKHEDYDATVEIFKEELAVNPHLLTQLQRAPDPAMYAYNVGKQVQAARSYGT